VAAQRGFCPYCAHINPPDFKFCVGCQKKLPPEVLGAAAGEPPTPKELEAAADGRPPEPPEAPPPKSARWVILVLTIGIAIVVLVASIGLLTHFLAGAPAGAQKTSGSLVRVDLCQNTSGADCKGNQIVLPYESSAGLSENVTSCYAVYPKGDSARLWMNFSTTSRIYGVLIPEPLYRGAVTSYFTNPSGFYNSSAAVAQAAWNSGQVFGGALVNVSIPSGFPEWCMAWWNPGTTGEITFTADVYLIEEAN